MDDTSPPQPADFINRRSETRVFLQTAGLGALLIPTAFLFAAGLPIDLLGLIRLDVRDALIGLAATAPLIASLRWFMISQWNPLVRFRLSQLKFFSEIGFELTPARNAVLAVIAGVSEELLFRGVLQSAAERFLPVVFAIALPAILFGLLHARTVMYAVIAAAVGLYLGLMFWGTQGLTAPIITHTLYDFIAFEWTRRAVVEYRNSPSKSASHLPLP